MRLCFCTMPWIMRAIWSAPPPVPAGTTISTALVGCQAARAGVATVDANAAAAAQSQCGRDNSIRRSSSTVATLLEAPMRRRRAAWDTIYLASAIPEKHVARKLTEEAVAGV